MTEYVFVTCVHGTSTNIDHILRHKEKFDTFQRILTIQNRL